MLKTLLNTTLVFILFVINMAIFTWFLSYLGVGKPSLEKTPLISNVHADYASKRPMTVVVQPTVVQEVLPKAATPPPAVHQVKPLTPELRPIQSVKQSKENVAFRRTSLHFESTSIHFLPSERVKLETALQESRISPTHSVIILAGPAPSENNITSPQTSKLRAQTVARLMYAYTQNIKMLYRPEMEIGRVDVEFYSPKASKN